MTDYTALTYWQIKAECKKEGLDSTGKRPELVQRLYEKSGVTTDPIIPKEEQNKAPVDPTPTRLLMPNDILRPPVDNSKYAIHLTEERLARLERQCNSLAASKGHVKFELDYDNGAFQVGMYGGAGGPNSTTLISSDAQIIRKVQEYFSARFVQGKSGLTETMR